MAYSAANGTPCVLCGQAIDYDFTRAYPRHRLAGTVHHLIGLDQGGDPLDVANLAPAHLCCNAAESNRLRGQARKINVMQPAAVRNSRRW